MGNVKIANTWRTIKLPYARVSGTWRPCKQIYAKVGGVWKIAFDLTEADPFDGTGTLSEKPGYVPWEQLSGTWTKSGGNVSTSSTTGVAAIETGVADGEWEIDTAATTTGGPGVGFWISDQSNWWGVRFYTEQYSYTIPGNAFFYNHNVYTATTFRPAGTYNPPTFVSCLTSISYSRYVSSNNFINQSNRNRYCTCNTTANSSCVANFNVAAATCVTSCTASTPSTACTNSNKGTVAWGRVCGTTGCTPCPVSNVCGTCPADTGNINYSTPCPSSFTTNLNNSNTAGCTCRCNTTTTSNANNNIGGYNCPTTSTTYSNSQSFSCPSSTSLPNCSFVFNNNPATSYTYTCNYGGQYAGTNPATPATGIYKRGQLVQSVSGVVNIVSNQDFGDVGNLYAKTYGNSVDFKQYNTAGRAGGASNTVTYAAPAGTKGTKHGIIITSVPYTQTYNIGRFKATV